MSTTTMYSIDRRDRLERTASMANNKGLLNKPGENNCFLNSAVQVLWHLDVFRRSFRELTGHFCMGKSCIFCALDFIFKQFQDSNNDALPPDALRFALAVTFKDQQKFQLGDMDDAAECFENILSRLHFHLASEKHDDGCNAKHCISHQKFAMQLIEQTMCPCGERSEPLPFFQLVHYVATSALCARAKNHPSSFGTLLRRAGEDIRRCPSPDCGERVRVQHLLLNCPDIVSIGLIWDSESPDIEHIADVLECIGTRIRLQDLFHQVYDERAATVTMNLVGIVTYYGKHYSTFFFHSKLRTWIYFDDARVKEIGSDWSVIIDKCLQCHYQPLLLLYANPLGTPVNADTAPRERIQIDNARPMRVGVDTWKRNTLERIHGLRDPERISGGTPLSRNHDVTEVVSSKPPKPFARRSRSVDDLDSSDPAPKPLSRTPSVGSDLANSPGKRSVSSTESSGKEKRKHKIKRIGSAIIHAMQPALAVSKSGGKNSLPSKKKNPKKPRRSSTGSSCSSGEQDLMDFTSKHEQATREIMRLYDESKAINARSRTNGHDSGISSAPSSATESVSSTDTVHGGSDEDLMTFKQNTVQRRPPKDNTLKGSGAPHQTKLEALLDDAEQKLFMSQNAENHQDYATALGYCTDAATRFRAVTEVPGASVNTINYANMKRVTCLSKARFLRERVQAQPPDREAADTTATLTKRDEETLTRQRPQLIIPQQQPNRPPPYGTLPRKIHTAKEPFGSSLQAQKITEEPDSGKQDRRFFLSQAENQFSSLPAAKSKRAGAVHSSGHYTSSKAPHHTGRGSCSQQIKPDAWCYSPVHYDDVNARMQSLAIQPSSLSGDKRSARNHDPRIGPIPERREDSEHRSVPSVQHWNHPASERFGPIPERREDSEHRSVASAQHRIHPASEQFGSIPERRDDLEHRSVPSVQHRHHSASEQFGPIPEHREDPMPEHRTVPSSQHRKYPVFEQQSRTRVYAVEDGGAIEQTKPPAYSRNPPRTVYVSASQDSRRVNGYESSPEFSGGNSTRRQPKVVYAGKCPLSTTRSTSLQTARSTEALNNVNSAPAYEAHPQRSAATQARQPYGQRPAPAYVAAPSYNHTQQLRSQSASAIVKPRYPTSVHNSPMGSPSNARLMQPSANISDRLFCERCRQVPIRRTQRICAACEAEMAERHMTSTAGLY